MNRHIRVDGQIGVEYVYVWKWKVLNPQRKIQKYPDTCGRGPSLRLKKKEKKKKKERNGDLTN